MNNSFTQKAQHYLNESYRLTEELDAEIEYSALLEAVLEELVGTENFLALMEISPELKRRYTKAALQNINKRTSTLEKLSNEKAGSIGDWHRANQRHHRALALPSLDGHAHNLISQEAANRDAAEHKFIEISGKQAAEQHKIGRRTRGIGKATS